MKKEIFNPYQGPKTYRCRPMDPNVTIRQIKAMNLPGYWSWGVQPNIYVTRNKQDNFIDGMYLTVNGHHHKGRVWIFLAFDDTYTVVFTSRQNRYVPSKDVVTGVYAEDLFSIIDKRVEYIPDYKNN